MNSLDRLCSQLMYAFIRGKLAHASPGSAIVEAGGVGYRILIPINLAGKLPSVGSEVILYTSFVVREASQALYGFSNPKEQDAFEILITVSGIGPKTALSLLGHLDLTGLADAIRNGNISLLSKVPGIGKKTAERIVLELRGRLDSAASDGPLSNSKVQDALNALMHLGYSQTAAEKAVRKAALDFPDSDLSSLITAALKS